MSLEDLENMGMLLPREQWGKYELRPSVNKPLLIAIGMGTLVSAVLMYFGDGGLYTWLGAVLFLIMLFGFTFLSVRAVDKGLIRQVKADEGGVAS